MGAPVNRAISTRSKALLACVALAALVRSSVSAALSPCALSDAQHFVASTECAPFTTISARAIALFTKNSFLHVHDPEEIAALDDGSLVVQVSDNGLFRIDPAGRVHMLWAPRQNWPHYPPLTTRPWPGEPTPTPLPTPTNYGVELLGAFDRTAVFQYAESWLYGIREDGSVALRFPRYEPQHTIQPSFIGRDRDGALWFSSWSTLLQHNVAYAYVPNLNRLSALPVSVSDTFEGPSGFVYAAAEKNLVELRAISEATSRYFRGPILLSSGDQGTREFNVSRLGPDGSAWASTITDIVHEHPDGRVAIIPLSRMPTVITHPMISMPFVIAPDGSAWIAGGGRLVRITKGDRVDLLRFPETTYPRERFAKDGTMWVLFAKDGQNVVEHFAPPAD